MSSTFLKKYKIFFLATLEPPKIGHMTFFQTMKHLEELLMQMELSELPVARAQIAHLDGKLVSKINQMKQSKKDNQK